MPKQLLVRSYQCAAITAVLIGFLFHAVVAQNPKIDSLKSVLENQPPDTNKVNTLIDLAFELRAIDANATIAYAREAAQLAASLKFTRGESQALRNVGLGFSYTGETDSAILFCQKALVIAEAHGHLQIQADAYNTIGNSYIRRSLYDSARAAFKKSLALFLKLGNKESLGISQASIAITYSEQGKFSQALEMYQEALMVFEEAQHFGMLANLHNNIANIYLERDDFDQAYLNYLKTSEYDSITGNKAGRSQTMMNMGNVLVHLKKTEEAKSSYRLAINLANSSGAECRTSMPMTQLGDLFLDEQSYDSAYYYISKALQVAKDCEFSRSMAAAYLDLGQYYRVTGQLGLAEKQLLEGYSVAAQNELRPQMAEISNGLYQVYEAMGDYKKAFLQLQLSRDLEKELFNKENTEKIARLEAEYEFEKEKQQIAAEQSRVELAYEQQQERDRFKLIGLAGLAIGVALIAFLSHRAFRIKQKANILLKDKNLRLKELRENEKKLSEEAMALKDRELATMAMATHEKNGLLKDLEQKISFVEGRISTDELKPSLREMQKTIAESYSLDKSWDSFIHRFEDVHPKFFDRLKDENPNLTVEDLKLCAYLKIGMANKEIANVTHLALASVKSKINRLKKKLEMGPEDNVRDYMLRYVS